VSAGCREAVLAASPAEVSAALLADAAEARAVSPEDAAASPVAAAAVAASWDAIRGGRRLR
jgi:hypothetical protein